MEKTTAVCNSYFFCAEKAKKNQSPACSKYMFKSCGVSFPVALVAWAETRTVRPTLTSWTLSGGGFGWCGPLAMFITLFLSERRLCRRRSCNFFLCFLCMKHRNGFNRQKESSCTFQHNNAGDNNITSLFFCQNFLRCCYSSEQLWKPQV